MKSEWTSSTAGLRRDKLSKVPTKTLTWYWCRTVWERPSRKQRLSEVEKGISRPRKTSTSQGLARPSQLWETKSQAIKMMGLIVFLDKSKRRSNIIGFTLTALKRRLKWWESSINQHQSWGLMSKDRQIVPHNKSHPTKMLMQWILINLLAISLHQWMNNQSLGMDKEMSTQEALIESLNLFSHQLENLNKILTQITWNRTSRLTSIIILPSQSLIWSMKILTWSNRFKASLSQLQMQLVLVRRSSNPILTITVRIEIGATWPLSSQLTSQEGQWQVKTLTSQSLKLKLVPIHQRENNSMV